MKVDISKTKANLIQWIRDWFSSNGNNETKAILGISGGKDSSICAALLKEALGKDRVIGILMPNGTQSDINDSIELVNHLGIANYTINMSNVNIGVKNSGTYNNFRTVYVKCLNASAESVGLYEAGGDNVYELCTAEDFTCGYFIKDSLKNVFEACNSSWTRADVTTQNAFVAEGAFNSLITASAAKFFDSTSENSYIKFDIVGSGIVKAPIFEESLCDDDAYKTVLAGTVVFAK